MRQKSISVANAKTHLSDLLGRVAYGGETVVITRRGRPMAKLVPAEPAESLASVRGWLDDDDPFFGNVEAIVRERPRHRPRVYRKRRSS